ncbi:MAG: bifunctional DNA-formamidopyrimidine glycosylase/DNA-(apurinic or apyrimidinic site) lyase [Candidatus Wallbacteria bacterium]|nr:bifunctional DNA-formamidopyrimidine glycosylase/DNA-(apurinic or apyrimidinic site) lyase [Candidatus Wallbacteria bacterium]
MPELPEVETIANGLREKLIGSRIVTVDVLDQKLSFLNTAVLTGERITAVLRKGKLLGLELDKTAVIFHLRMTGRLLYTDKYSPLRHDRLVLHLDRGVVVFNDSRRFGTVRVCDFADACTRLGPEPLEKGFSAAYLLQAFSRIRRPVKSVLLEQNIVAGIGNIYACEILHKAGIDPQTPACALKPAELKKLASASKSILKKACEMRGTTFSDYRDSEGRSGSFQDCLQVYQREGAACSRCGRKILRIRQQQRSTFYCPGCQK